MKNFYNSKLIKCVSNVKTYLILVMILLSVSASQAQVTVTGNAAGSYADLNTAINAVNALTTLTQNTVITLTAATPQTAPAGGYAITATGTALFSLTIAGNGNTVTAFTPQVAGALNDGIFKLIGADYVTIQGFVMQENVANTITAGATNTMTEFGVALFYASPTDGAQNNTIQNNTITLNRAYSNTFGIYSNTRHSATLPLTVAEVTAASGTNSNNKIYSNTISNVDRGIIFVGSTTSPILLDSGNDIGGTSAATGNTITNWGGLVSGSLSNYPSVTGSAVCIYMNHQVGDNVSFNTVTSATNITITTTGFFGIFKAFTVGQPTGLTFTSNYSNNTITMSNAPTTSEMQCMSLQGLAALPTATINCNNNSIINSAITGATATTAAMIGILSSSAPGTLNITSNTIRGFTTTATTTGRFLGIQQQTAGVVNVFNITNNKIGDATAGAVTFLNTTTTATVTGISVTATGAAATCALSITGNDIRGVNYVTSGTGNHTYIINAAGALTQNISNNTFTNLNVNTTGGVTFISNNNSALVNTTKNVNNNSIVTGFTKGSAGGTVTLFTDTGTDVLGSFNNSNNNNFSNITVTGATIIGGFTNTNIGTATKTVTGNILSNWIGGTLGIIGLSVSSSGTSTVSGNTVSNISSAGSITGIVSNGLFESLNQNTIHTLLSSGANAIVMGISNIGGTIKNFSRNKIYNLENNGAGGTVNGISVSAGTTVTLQNNLIGDLRTPTANAANPLIGINVTGGTTVNAFYNTVMITGSSSGALFGASAISASTTPALTLRNNIFVNNCTPVGATGFASAYRRLTTTLTTYNGASNNNLFFAGTPGVNNLIHYDGTNSYQTLATFKTAMGTRDAQSITENPTFVSTVGSNASFLHISTSVATQIEGGATAVAGITGDFAGDERNVSTPDIGADEFAGILLDLSSPTILAIALTTDSCNTTSRTITATITDPSNVSIAANAPRIYFRKNAGAYFSVAGTQTSGTVASGTWSFNLPYATLGGVVVADVIDYYIVAQDALGNAGGSPFLGLVLTNVNTITTPPTTPLTYAIQGSIGGSYNVGVGQTYTTLTAAINAYNTSCLSSAVTFVLTDVSYSAAETFPISVNANFDASATKTLTIRPAAAGTSITGATATNALIRMNGANFVNINGSTSGGVDRSLTISNTSTTSPSVILIGSVGTTPTTNNAVRNCIIINGATTASAIVISDAAVLGNAGLFSNITIHNNDIQRAFTGVFAQGGTMPQGGSNLTYTNNTLNTTGVNAIGRIGLYMQGVNGATVSNNTIGDFDAAVGENDTAIWLATATTNAIVSVNNVSNLGMTLTTGFAPRGIIESSGSVASGNVISNNTITNLTTTGSVPVIGIDNSGGGTIIERNRISGISNNSTSTYGATGINISGNNNAVIRNNFVSNINGVMTGGSAFSTTLAITGIRIGAGTGHQVYFNSVNLYGLRPGTATANLLTAAFAMETSASTGCDVRNNIFANNITGGTTSIANVSVYLPSGATSAMNLTMNRNLLYYGTDPAAGAGQAGTTAGTNFFVGLPALASYSTTLSAAGTNNNASQAFTTAVPFTAPTDLLVTVSNDAGVTIPSVPADILGFTRTATPDIGAHEFTPPCTGAVGGTTVATVTSFCNPTSSTTITASGYSILNPNITYLWQRSADLAFTSPIDIGTSSATYADLNTGVIAATTFYRLRVVCSTGAGFTSFSTIATVTINATPAVPVPGTVTQPTCAVATGTFQITGFDATRTYTFTPAVVSTSPTGLVTANAGTYSFTVNNAAGCTSLASANIVVNAQPATPTAPVAGTVTQPTCSVATGTFQITGFDATRTYTFTPAVVNTSATGLVTANAGTYTFTVNNAAGCTSLASANIVVNAQPATPAAPVPGTVTQPTCSVATGTFQITGFDATRTYTFTPAVVSTSATGLVTANAGTYTFTVNNAVGCTSLASANIVVNAQPATPAAPVAGTVTQPTCAVATGTFQITGFDATRTYTFTPAVVSTSATGLVTANAGTYTFRVNNAAGCISVPSANIVVNAQPATPATPTGNAAQTINVANVNSATIASLIVSPTTGILWYASLANAQSGTNALATTTVLTTGATYWAVNGGTPCNSAPFAVTVTVALGVNGFDNANFSFYPNPTTSIINLGYSSAITKVTVMSLLGQILQENKSNKLQVAVDLSSYPAATYLLKVEADGQSRIIKVVKN